jgi:ribosomal protein S6--L-glutamate ligase
MILSFHPCLDADVQIILGDESLGSEHIDLIQNATAIILPQGKTHELYDVCSSSKALIFPDYKMRFEYPGKTGQTLLFRDYGFPHPQTSIWNTVKEFKDAHSDSERFPHDRPFFVKKDTGHEAEGVYFVEESVSLSNALSLLAQRESEGQRGFVTQAFVPCGGNVLRAVIIGKQIVTYWKRPGKPDQVITTISRGAVIGNFNSRAVGLAPLTYVHIHLPGPRAVKFTEKNLLPGPKHKPAISNQYGYRASH